MGVRACGGHPRVWLARMLKERRSSAARLKEGEPMLTETFALMPTEILIVMAAVYVGLLCTWRTELHGLALSAIRLGGPHPFRRHSSIQRQREEAATATQSRPAPCTVYTAGSCDPDPGPGGWTYLQVIDGTAREESGEHPDTTTIRMELTAAIKAL